MKLAKKPIKHFDLLDNDPALVKRLFELKSEVAYWKRQATTLGGGSRTRVAWALPRSLQTPTTEKPK